MNQLGLMFLTLSMLGAPSAIAAKVAKVATTAPTVEAAPSYQLKSGKIEYFGLGKPFNLKIHGTSEKMTGMMQKTGNSIQGKFEIVLESFTTGMDTRDDHTRKQVFETSKFTQASMTIENLTIPEGKLGKNEALPFSGMLDFHGTKKKVEGKVDLTLGEKSIKYNSTFEIKMTDFGITPPEYMKMTVQNEVKVQVDGEAVLP
jgi:polyisoprenoid-binding protein YceI